LDYFTMASELYQRAIEKVINDSDLDTVITWPDDKTSILFSCTDQIRRHFFSQFVEPCAILNIKSGGCSEDCAFCSQSAHNKAEVSVQDLVSEEEIVSGWDEAQKNNLSFGVVSSGRKLSPSELQKVAAALKKCNGESHASLGILTDDEFSLLRKAGVVCYNHNIETSRNHFGKIVKTHTYDDRINTVKRAKKAGMKVCCGGIFGMGETWEDRKAMALELRELDVDTIPLNFLNAIPGTQVGKPVEHALEFLKIIALFRVCLPDKTIKVCGGREVNLGRLQGLMFYAGANGYISGDYLTTAGDSVESDDAMIRDLGLIKGKE